MPDADPVPDLIGCLRCGGLYERPRRSFSHFCPACRVLRNRERTAERARETRAAERAVRDQLDTYLDRGVEHGFIEPYLADLAVIMGSAALTRAVMPRDETVEDRMPPGSNSPRGPDDGMSTTRPDLAATLDETAARVAAHPWFAAHPHWAYDLHGDDVDTEHLRTA